MIFGFYFKKTMEKMTLHLLALNLKNLQEIMCKNFFMCTVTFLESLRWMEEELFVLTSVVVYIYIYIYICVCV